MANYNSYTDSQKKEAVQLYQDKSLTLYQIEELTGMNRSAISRCAKEAGIPLRHQRSSVSITRARTCKHCRKSIKVLGARFCPFCGKIVLSKKEVAHQAIEKLEDLMNNSFELGDELEIVNLALFDIRTYIENSNEIK